MACTAVFLAHLQEGTRAEPDPMHLIISSQALLVRLFGGLVPNPDILVGLPFTVCVFAFFVVALVVATGGRPPSGRAKALVVSAQLLIGLLFNNDLLLVLAAQLPIIYRTEVALRWLLLQSAGMVLTWAAVVATADVSIGSDALSESLLAPQDVRIQLAGTVGTLLLIFFAWQLFAFGLGYIAISERRSRERLAAANSQLLAAQQLLGESARSGERLRIARELHDGMGHHLTALSLHLELAAQQAPESQAASVLTAKSIARDLLQEVRTAVGKERTEAPIDLERSLRTMCAGIPAFQVTLDIGPDCGFQDPVPAHATFRGIQEAITNVMHHSDAENVSITMRRSAQGIRTEIKDDGRCPASFRVGNGLRGMRERIEACGGSMAIRSDPGSGFSVSFWLPPTQGAQ